MIEKCDYKMKVNGKKIRSKGYVIESRDEYCWVWDEKYGKNFVEKKDVTVITPENWSTSPS